MKTKVTILSLVILTLTFMGCGKEETEEKEVLRNVVYTRVSESTSTVEKTFSGTVKGATEANISFRVPGNLMTKYVGLGAAVRQGEVIAALDPQDYQINYAEAKATLAEAQADVTRTAADFRRYRELFLNDNASKAEYDNSKAAYQAALARLDASRERVSFAELQLSYTKLVAPFSGTITVEMADESENLGAGSPVFTLVREESPEVQIFLPEDFTNQVKVGEPVVITVSALGGESFSGVVKEIGSGITGIGNTFPAKISITDASTNIKTGMTAQVSLGLTNPNAGRLLIPLSAVTEDGSGNRFVYVISSVEDREAVLAKREVKLGTLIGREIEIISGLESGDRVVTAGVNYVYDGQKVKVSTQN